VRKLKQIPMKRLYLSTPRINTMVVVVLERTAGKERKGTHFGSSWAAANLPSESAATRVTRNSLGRMAANSARWICPILQVFRCKPYTLNPLHRSTVTRTVMTRNFKPDSERLGSGGPGPVSH
jgi:hypothetical protein